MHRFCLTRNTRNMNKGGRQTFFLGYKYQTANLEYNDRTARRMRVAIGMLFTEKYNIKMYKKKTKIMAFEKNNINNIINNSHSLKDNY